jgi:ATP-dependent Lhr-like helicase
LWQLNWSSLRDIQEESIEPILAKNTDVIISAPTATGKTEAAFLPILSSIVSDGNKSLSCLYISPLKALINDQFDRLGLFCEKLEIPIHEWHGDVIQSRKKEVLDNPSGILLITPESLEALFVNRGHVIPTLFSNLQYIVIDEIHSFIGIERGKQLQSLLHRIEVATQKTIPRIGLSATIGDLEYAAKYLRSENNFTCKLIQSQSGGQEIKLQLRGYKISEKQHSEFIEEDDSEPSYGDKIEIAEHLFKTLRGSNNLIFANSRSNTEQYADLLREMCENQGLPNEFYPHHGSLSKELREDVEERLKSQSLPITAVCTSTLELGIDIGNVKSIAQIGTPPSVSSLRQRLGRSGRRGEAAIMRIYIQEKEITSNTSVIDCLRTELVQTVALINLLIEGWYEKAKDGRLHLSTMIQQILSLLSQYGSLTSSELWKVMCLKAPFYYVSESVFIDLLKCLGKSENITQMSDNSIALGVKGERIVSHYSFYSAFTTPQEYQIYNKGRQLGTIPITITLSAGLCIIFSGRRWKITSIDVDKKVIDVERSRGGRAPHFGGEGGAIADTVRKEMYKVYTSSDIPAYLDQNAKSLLQEARSYFQRYELQKNNFLQDRNAILFFHWSSDIVANTFLLHLKQEGLEVTNEGIALHIANAQIESVKKIFDDIKSKGFTNEYELADALNNKAIEKYDNLLSDDLLIREYCSRSIDVQEAEKVLLSIN